MSRPVSINSSAVKVFEECQFCTGLFPLATLEAHIRLGHESEWESNQRRLSTIRHVFAVTPLRSRDIFKNAHEFDPMRMAKKFQNFAQQSAISSAIKREPSVCSNRPTTASALETETESSNKTTHKTATGTAAIEMRTERGASVSSATATDKIVVCMSPIGRHGDNDGQTKAGPASDQDSDAGGAGGGPDSDRESDESYVDKSTKKTRRYDQLAFRPQGIYVRHVQPPLSEPWFEKPDVSKELASRPRPGFERLMSEISNDISVNGPFASTEKFVRRMREMRDAKFVRVLQPLQCETTPSGVTWLPLANMNIYIALNYMTALRDHSYLATKRMPIYAPYDRSKAYIFDVEAVRRKMNRPSAKIDLRADNRDCGPTAIIMQRAYYCRRQENGDWMAVYDWAVKTGKRYPDLVDKFTHLAYFRRVRVNSCPDLIKTRILITPYEKYLKHKQHPRLCRKQYVDYDIEIVHYCWVANPRPFRIIEGAIQRSGRTTMNPELEKDSSEGEDGDDNLVLKVKRERPKGTTYRKIADKESLRRLRERIVLGHPTLYSKDDHRVDITCNGPYLEFDEFADRVLEARRAEPQPIIPATQCVNVRGTTWIPLEFVNNIIAMNYLTGVKQRSYLLSSKLPKEPPCDRSSCFIFDLNAARRRDSKTNWEHEASNERCGVLTDLRCEHKIVRLQPDGKWSFTTVSARETAQLADSSDVEFTDAYVLRMISNYVRSCPDLVVTRYNVVTLKNFCQQSARRLKAGEIELGKHSRKNPVRFDYAMTHYFWVGPARRFEIKKHVRKYKKPQGVAAHWARVKRRKMGVPSSDEEDNGSDLDDVSLDGYNDNNGYDATYEDEELIGEFEASVVP